MAQIIGSGNPVNPALASFFDTSIDFSGLGLVDRFEFRSGRVVAADQGGVRRVSAVLPTGTGRSLLQPAPANQPQHIPGGGPNGLTDALFFSRIRPDRMDLGDVLPGTSTRVVICRPEINLLPAGTTPNMHVLGTTNFGNNRVLLFFRRTSETTMELWAWIGGDATAARGLAVLTTAAAPLSSRLAVAMTIDAATRTVAAGVRAQGAAGWTWITAVYPETNPPLAAPQTLGSRGTGILTTDGYEGRMAGLLTANGRDARTDAALLDQINAWAFGPNSLFGL